MHIRLRPKILGPLLFIIFFEKPSRENAGSGRAALGPRICSRGEAGNFSQRLRVLVVAMGTMKMEPMEPLTRDSPPVLGVTWEHSSPTCFAAFSWLRGECKPKAIRLQLPKL